jgi:hypothetical protein
MNWRGCGRKQLMASFELLFWHLYGSNKGNHEKLSEHSQDLCHDLNLGPPKCETKTLIIHPDIGLC